MKMKMEGQKREGELLLRAKVGTLLLLGGEGERWA